VRNAGSRIGRNAVEALARAEISQLENESLSSSPSTAVATDQWLRQLWEHTSEAMVLSDPGGIVLAANPAYYRLYGYGPEEVLGKSFALIFPPD
jgi:PAS domain-containing protein